ncbi:hypothetical protein F1640_14950 [Novosphingobium sp. NBM11]|uniref:hypothetical protein n=1 Tax=Novosphingobium sp. NBM11 TaxID=2596914 RepID=UPI00189207E3|nr:hypothetical protein [Novosphingobium sp. NBM11]MBF5091284.1 hypothetical protein [Novosphingobium sp. NBM11]
MAEIIGGGKFEQVLSALGERLGKKVQVNVGFLDSASYPDKDINVPTVAAINNFGAPEAGIPARPFFSNMIAENSGEWADKFATVLKSCNYDTDQALELMGNGMMGQLIESIVNTDSPPNADVTNLLKQRFPTGEGVTFADVQQARRDVAAGATAPAGKPLSWSGNLLHSVDKEVL